MRFDSSPFQNQPVKIGLSFLLLPDFEQAQKLGIIILSDT